MVATIHGYSRRSVASWIESSVRPALAARRNAAISGSASTAPATSRADSGASVTVSSVAPPATAANGLRCANAATVATMTARVFVYQRNVERLAGSVEHVAGEIRAALEREISATFLEPDGPLAQQQKTLN